MMIYTLTICYGVFLAMCGQIRTYDFPDVASCERERAAQEKYIDNGHAVCAPKVIKKEEQEGAEHD